MAWICQSGRPAAAAVVAAPMRKEWLANEAGVQPATDWRRRLRWRVRHGGVRKEPFAKVKRGVGAAEVGRWWR